LSGITIIRQAFRNLSTQELESLLQAELPRSLAREIRLELWRRKKHHEERLLIGYDIVERQGDILVIATNNGRILAIPIQHLIGYDFIMNT